MVRTLKYVFVYAQAILNLPFFGQICSQFEFVNRNTLWGDTVTPVTKENIDAKAALIVDQYKKKAALFKTGNNVLIPLGDDFKYFDQNYMDTMTNNFDQLFKYINENRSKFKVTK